MTKTELLDKLHELQDEFSAVAGSAGYVRQELTSLIDNEELDNDELYEISDMCYDLETEVTDKFNELMTTLKSSLEIEDTDILYNNH